MDVLAMLAILGYTATIFELGYMIGQNHSRMQK